MVEGQTDRYVPDKTITKEELMALVEQVTERLLNHPNDPALETIKMQVG